MVTGALKPPQQDERSDDDGDEDEEWRGIQPIAFVPFSNKAAFSYGNLKVQPFLRQN